MSGGTRGLWADVRRMAEPYGYTLITTGKGHAKLVRPGHRPIPVPSSPRNVHGALRAIRAVLERSPAPVPAPAPEGRGVATLAGPTRRPGPGPLRGGSTGSTGSTSPPAAPGSGAGS